MNTSIQNTKLRVLVSAYACEPNKGSEPGVGWNWVKQIARFNEVWVITRANNRQSIESEYQPLQNVHWVYYDLPYWARFWKRGERGLYIYYYLWQLGVFFLARRLVRQVDFDLAHHVTFVNYWMPSFLPLLNLPFVWGPVGGGERIPSSLLSTFDVRSRIYERFRKIIQWRTKYDPFVRIAAHKATVALATTEETAACLQVVGAKRVHVLSQVALSKDECNTLSSAVNRRSHPFRCLSAGRLIDWKGFHLGLAAFAKLIRVHPSSEYWFVGDGHARKRLERLAAEYGISESVHFWGNISRQQAWQLMSESDVLVHPSMRDSGGMVCVEAMAAGKPVICLDTGGPAMQVTSETGFKIPPGIPERVVDDIANAMIELAGDPESRAKYGEAARKKVEEDFTWDRKGAYMQRIYEQAKRTN